MSGRLEPLPSATLRQCQVQRQENQVTPQETHARELSWPLFARKNSPHQSHTRFPHCTASSAMSEFRAVGALVRRAAVSWQFPAPGIQGVTALTPSWLWDPSHGRGCRVGGEGFLWGEARLGGRVQVSTAGSGQGPGGAVRLTTVVRTEAPTPPVQRPHVQLRNGVRAPALGGEGVPGLAREEILGAAGPGRGSANESVALSGKTEHSCLLCWTCCTGQLCAAASLKRRATEDCLSNCGQALHQRKLQRPM